MVGVRFIQVLEVADFEDVEELGDVGDAFVGVVVVFPVVAGEADGFAGDSSEAGRWGDDAFFGAYQGAPGRLPQGRGLSHDAL